MFATRVGQARSKAAAPRTPDRLDVARLPIYQGGQIQPALEIGRIDDPLEQDADRVADRVMRAPDPELRAGVGPLRPGRSGQSSGRPLDTATRAFFEPRFGHDFSRVRVHTDGKAADSARAVRALAYTVGGDIVFGAGKFAPATPAGARLLAHELAHTVQQPAATSRTIRRRVEVGDGLALNTHGFTLAKTGNFYSCSRVVKKSLFNEVFTSLFFSPRVFKIAGATSKAVDENFSKHMNARIGIVNFAAKKQYTFAAGSAFKMNPAFWDVGKTSYKPKAGVDRAKAIQDLNVHPKEYAIACLAATQLTMEGGGKSPLTKDYGAEEDDWIPGDWGYIENTKFPPTGGQPGLEGENIIYTGRDLWWGHFGPGLEYKSLRAWFNQVQGWHGGAEIKDHRERPTIGLA